MKVIVEIEIDGIAVKTFADIADHLGRAVNVLYNMEEKDVDDTDIGIRFRIQGHNGKAIGKLTISDVIED